MPSSFLKPDLIRDEGERHVAYRDTTGNVTWGIGHKDDLAHVGQVFTPAQVDAAFEQDVRTAEEGISHALPWFSTLSPLRQDCLVNMTFNLGLHGLLEFKTFLGFMQAGKYAQAGLDLRGTLWYKQVGNRAQRIIDQIITNQHVQFTPAPKAIAAVPAPVVATPVLTTPAPAPIIKVDPRPRTGTMSVLTFVRPFMGFINSAVLGQLRGFSYAGSTALASRGFITQDQTTAAAGCIWFVGTALLQLADNFIVDGKITRAVNAPPPLAPALPFVDKLAPAYSAPVPAPVAAPAAQVTMQPIPDPN